MLSILSSNETLSEFLLNAPLYEVHQLSSGSAALSTIFGKAREKFIFDGYCPHCNRETNYLLSQAAHIPGGDPWNNIKTHEDFLDITITCVRKPKHIVQFYLFLSEMNIQKIGQLPSLAEIENGKCEIYRKNMTKIDSSELYKAIGLAAHGVGIGSFVYLRRILERIVMVKFKKFKDIEQWDEKEFNQKKMAEQIKFLKDHLPQFLVNNQKIYSILSIGIHELNENECLKVFEILKRSIIYIIEEDLRKQEELAARKELEDAIASFN